MNRVSPNPSKYAHPVSMTNMDDMYRTDTFADVRKASTEQLADEWDRIADHTDDWRGNPVLRELDLRYAQEICMVMNFELEQMIDQLDDDVPSQAAKLMAIENELERRTEPVEPEDDTPSLDDPWWEHR